MHAWGEYGPFAPLYNCLMHPFQTFQPKIKATYVSKISISKLAFEFLISLTRGLNFYFRKALDFDEAIIKEDLNGLQQGE